MTVERVLMAVGAGSAFIAVALGAFAAHGLRGRLGPDSLAVFETAVRYQMYHALAIVAVAVALERAAGGLLVWAAWAFAVGTVLFSGSLYLLAVTGHRWLGAVTPLGGVSFLLGWALVTWAALTRGS